MSGTFQENQEIKVVTTPFEKSSKNPGYGEAVMYRDASGKAVFVSAAHPLPSTASVTVDTMSITAEMKETSSQDYYVTTTNLGDGTLTIGFDDASSFTVAGALALQDIVTVENKTQGWVYNTAGATVADTSILLVAANQVTGYPVPGALDEFEIVYRGIDRAGQANALLTTIDSDTDAIKTAVEIMDNSETTISSTDVKRVAIFGDDDSQITAFGSPSTISTHRSPSDYIAVFTSSTTITLSGHDTITNNSQLVYIRYVPTGGADSAVLVNGSGGVTFSYSANVITVNGGGTPFASGDSYEVGINYQDKGFDASLDVVKIIPQANASKLATSPEAYTVLTATTTAYVEGVVIDTRAYTDVLFHYSKTASDADNSYLKVSTLLTADGTADYQQTSITAPSSGVSVIDDNVYERDKAALVEVISIPTNGANFMRFDLAKVADTGTDSVWTPYITKVPR